MIASYAAASGQLVGHDRRGIARGVRRAARRHHRDEPRDAVDELQLRRQLGEGLQLCASGVGPLDHHQHIVLARGKAPVDRLVAAKLLGVGAKQLRQRSSTWSLVTPMPASTVITAASTATT